MTGSDKGKRNDEFWVETIIYNIEETQFYPWIFLTKKITVPPYKDLLLMIPQAQEINTKFQTDVNYMFPTIFLNFSDSQCLSQFYVQINNAL